jgi:hypothetical protein
MSGTESDGLLGRAPETATVEDIQHTYNQSYTQGLLQQQSPRHETNFSSSLGELCRKTFWPWLR